MDAANLNDRHIDEELERELVELRKLIKEAHQVLEGRESVKTRDSKGETDIEQETPQERGL